MIDARDDKGRTPVEIAEENRQTAVANYLKSAMFIPEIKVIGTDFGFACPEWLQCVPKPANSWLALFRARNCCFSWMGTTVAFQKLCSIISDVCGTNAPQCVQFAPNTKTANHEKRRARCEELHGWPPYVHVFRFLLSLNTREKSNN